VPLVGRGHDHGVDVVAGEDLREIGAGLAAALGRAELAAVLVSVGAGHALGALDLLELTEQVTALTSHADMAEGHALAGRRLRLIAERGSGDHVWEGHRRGRPS